MSEKLFGTGGATSSATAEGHVCHRCNRELPLRMAASGEAAAVWLCVECGLPFPAVCLPDRLPALSERVALDDRYFDTSYLPPITKETRSEIIRLAGDDGQNDFSEKRASPRIAVALLAAGVELDKAFYPISPTFQMMITNVSAEGIGMVSVGRLSSPFIALKMRSSYRAEPIQVIVEIVRQRELRSPYTEIGGRFVIRLGSTAR
ncbi:MAG: hypothetical protein CMJ58_16400 [Planctomycetaceae bacterium]|nr:hypothetical protein [Planctomycetaceae bacterium]